MASPRVHGHVSKMDTIDAQKAQVRKILNEFIFTFLIKNSSNRHKIKEWYITSQEGAVESFHD